MCDLRLGLVSLWLGLGKVRLGLGFEGIRKVEGSK